MIEEEYLSYPEQVTAFIDGELDPTESEGLFFEMARNPELQEMMRGQIKIKSAFQTGMLTAPAHLKENVLLRTGLAVTGAAVIAGESQSLLSKLFQSKAFIAICAATFSVIATALVYNYNQYENVISPKMNIASKQIHIEADNIAVRNSLSLPKSNTVPVSNSGSASATKRTHTMPPKHLLTSNVNQAAMPVMTETVQPEASPIATQPLPEQKFFAINNVAFAPISAPMSVGGGKPVLAIFSRDDEFNEFLENFSLQLRGFTAKSFTDVDIKSNTTPLLNNFGVAMFYDLGKHTAIGVEIGQENFLQKYTGTENGVPAEWQQNYTGFWTGLAFVYTMDEVYYIAPYGKVFVGGTGQGPVVKATLGGKFNVSDKLGVFAGLENTGLFYTFQNNMFSSYKLGLTAGITIKF